MIMALDEEASIKDYMKTLPRIYSFVLINLHWIRRMYIDYGQGSMGYENRKEANPGEILLLERWPYAAARDEN